MHKIQAAPLKYFWLSYTYVLYTFHAGRLIVLKYPYPREVEENPDYHSSFTAHFLANPPRDKRKGVGGMRKYQSESDMLSCSPADLSSPMSAEKSAALTKDTTSIHSLSVRFTSNYY